MVTLLLDLGPMAAVGVLVTIAICWGQAREARALVRDVRRRG